MADPMPTFDGTEPANLKAINNGNASAADAIHQQMIDDIHAEDAVPTVEDLPETGNWVGRTTYVVDVQRVYLCTALPSTWIRLDQLGYAITSATLSAGWTDVDRNTLLRQGGQAFFELNATRTSTLGVGGKVADIPSGYHGFLRRWTLGWSTFDTTNDFQIYYNEAVHEIQTREAIPSGQSLAVSMTWPLA